MIEAETLSQEEIKWRGGRRLLDRRNTKITHEGHVLWIKERKPIFHSRITVVNVMPMLPSDGRVRTNPYTMPKTPAP